MKNYFLNCLALMAIIVSLTFCSSRTDIIDPNPLIDPPINNSILIGVEYFAGWHSDDPKEDKWKMYQNGIDFTTMPKYAGRSPLLGNYNVQATMDAEINVASSNGIDFFSILWYYWGNAKEIAQYESKASIQRLNRGLEQYLASPNRNKMKFMMEACNADGALSVTTETGWDSIANVFVNAAKDPSYLRIDGRPVFKIHDASRFYLQLNCEINRCKYVIRNLRQKAIDAGLGEILIAIGTYGPGQISSGSTYTQYGVDFTMQYAGINETFPSFSQQRYEELGKYSKSLRDIRKFDALPWVPYIMSSWDASPWGGENRPYFDFPTREQWNKELTNIKTELMASTRFGFPKKDGSLQRAFTIYSWNEFGEGGTVAPTQGEKYMKLEEIVKVFGK